MRQEFTAQTRKEIKRACKGRVMNNLGRCIGINFLYMVPFALLLLMLYLSMFGRVLAMAMAGYTDEYMLAMALTRGMNTVWVVVFLMIVISGPLTFGLMRFYLALQRGEEPGVSTLFKPFTSLRSLWTGIKMEFCLTFRSFLWLIGPTVVYMVLVFSIAFSAAMSGSVGNVSGVMTILNILYFIALIPIEVKVMTYSAGWVILCDDETHGVWDATREASAAFKGQWGKLFVLLLTFVGWYIPVSYTHLDVYKRQVLVIFDRVFIPNEMIFLNGEVEFAGMMVERFAGYHRQSYGGCKVGVGDVLIGATALATEMAGCAKASHVKDKIIEMTHLNETLYCCGIACSSQGTKTKSGNYLIDLLLANVCKQNVTRFPYEIARLAQDLAGGLMVTQPSEADYRNPATHDYIEKYLKGVASVPTEDRMRVLRLIENMTMGTAAVGYEPESMHGAGSPQAQRIMIAVSYTHLCLIWRVCYHDRIVPCCCEIWVQRVLR